MTSTVVPMPGRHCSQVRRITECRGAGTGATQSRPGPPAQQPHPFWPTPPGNPHPANPQSVQIGSEGQPCTVPRARRASRVAVSRPSNLLQHRSRAQSSVVVPPMPRHSGHNPSALPRHMAGATCPGLPAPAPATAATAATAAVAPQHVQYGTQHTAHLPAPRPCRCRSNTPPSTHQTPLPAPRPSLLPPPYMSPMLHSRASSSLAARMF